LKARGGQRGDRGECCTRSRTLLACRWVGGFGFGAVGEHSEAGSMCAKRCTTRGCQQRSCACFHSHLAWLHPAYPRHSPAANSRVAPVGLPCSMVLLLLAAACRYVLGVQVCQEIPRLSTFACKRNGTQCRAKHSARRHSRHHSHPPFAVVRHVRWSHCPRLDWHESTFRWPLLPGHSSRSLTAMARSVDSMLCLFFLCWRCEDEPIHAFNVASVSE
jgi:hypothetical protein